MRKSIIVRSPDMVAVGKRMQYLRREAGMTQEGLAEILHVSRNAISRLECGTVEWQVTMLVDYLRAIDLDEIAVYPVLFPYEAQLFFGSLQRSGLREERLQKLLRLSLQLGMII